MNRTFPIQANGQITLPQEWRDKYGLTEGDTVAIFETQDGGLVVLPREAVGLAALERLRKGLMERGVTIEQLLKDGEQIRQEIYEEKYAGKVSRDA